MASILKVDTIQDQSGNNIINENADTITIGASGDTITIPSGATLDLSNATQTGVGGANTPAFEAINSGSQSISNNVKTKVQFQTENFDTNSCYDNSTNYRFTPTTAGKYYIYSTITVYHGNTLGQAGMIEIRKNNSGVFLSQTNVWSNSVLNLTSVSASTILTLNGSTDYVEIFGLSENVSGTPSFRGDFAGQCIFGGFKIIE